MSRRFASPPVWNDADLERDRRLAIAQFIAARSAEGNAPYRAALARNAAIVEALFVATDDLLRFSSGAALATDPSLTRIARYISGPPVSADDLDTLAGSRIATRKRLDLDLALKAAQVVESALDQDRFPWLFENPRRHPTDAERHTAIFWTAGLKTVQEIQTGRRGESSARQETAVEELLLNLGFCNVPPRPIDITGGIERGEFCRESLVAGTKCDIPVGLQDGRFLFIECKVSNTSTNSVKRLNRECRGKAAAWKTHFGERAISSVVLAGVFKLKNLRDAQRDQNLTIFWEHDLSPLADFLSAAT